MKTTFNISSAAAAKAAHLHTSAWKNFQATLFSIAGELIVMVEKAAKDGSFSVWFVADNELRAELNKLGNNPAYVIEFECLVNFDKARFCNVRSPRAGAMVSLPTDDKVQLFKAHVAQREQSTAAATMAAVDVVTAETIQQVGATAAEMLTTTTATIEKQVDGLSAAVEASGDAGLVAACAQVRELTRALHAQVDALDSNAVAAVINDKITEEVAKAVPDAATMINEIMKGFMPQLIEMKQAAELAAANKITEAMAASTAKVDGLSEVFADQLHKAKKEVADNMSAAMAAAAGVQAQALVDAKKEVALARANAQWGVGNFIEDHPVVSTVGGLAIIGAVGYGAWLYFGKGDTAA